MEWSQLRQSTWALHSPPSSRAIRPVSKIDNAQASAAEKSKTGERGSEDFQR